jgi:hypothetical protein
MTAKVIKLKELITETTEMLHHKIESTIEELAAYEEES